MKGIRIVVMVSAEAEWAIVRRLFPDVPPETSPFGELLPVSVSLGNDAEPVVVFHGGWGKIAAAASTQYAIDRWQPALLINLGTCGGFEGRVEEGEILLVERTLVYDIVEQMRDTAVGIAHYTTALDLSWLDEPLPIPATRSLLISADRDLIAEEIPALAETYGAIAGDWESGAIAYVAARNQVPCLILRGVSDVVGDKGGEAYGNFDLFARRAETIMGRLFRTLPQWIAMFTAGKHG